MKKPFIEITSAQLAELLIQARRVNDLGELIALAESITTKDLPDDIDKLKDKIDAALTESAKDLELDEAAEEMDVIVDEAND